MATLYITKDDTVVLNIKGESKKHLIDLKWYRVSFESGLLTVVFKRLNWVQCKGYLYGACMGDIGVNDVDLVKDEYIIERTITKKRLFRKSITTTVKEVKQGWVQLKDDDEDIKIRTLRYIVYND